MNGEGEDAGVVYCEMQGRENMEISRTYLNFTREIYPGVCGYKVKDISYHMLLETRASKFTQFSKGLKIKKSSLELRQSS